MNVKLAQVKEEIKKVLQGKDSTIDLVLCSLLAGGHILLEDIPGVGKTTLALALSKTLSMSYCRMQFTPDVLPSDILGFNMYESKTGDFTFRPGSIFTNLFLADEINRTSPKTQSALLEVMEEHRVTVDGVTRDLPSPFFVIATQNPVGASGTQKLPDSQLDRFFVRLSLGYPDTESATRLLMGHSSEQMDSVQTVLSLEELTAMQEKTAAVYADESLCRYIVALTEATRHSEFISQGVSPRGSIALLKMAKGHAFMQDRNFVTPEDVLAIMDSVCNHRIICSTRSKASGMTVSEILNRICRQIPMPKLS
ncbi:MAG: AAA family ATPase [Roseburia sp.]